MKRPARPYLYPSATRWLVSAVLLVFIAAGCQGGPDAAAVAGLEARAHSVLDRWATSVGNAASDVGLVGELTGQIGDWEPANGNNRGTLYAGLVQAAPSMSVEGTARPSVAVRWSDGRSVTVPVLA